MTNQEWAKHLLRMNLDLSGLYHSVIYVLLTKASMTFKIRYQLSGITFTCIIINNNLILGTSPSLNTQSCIKRLLVIYTVFMAFWAARAVMKLSAILLMQPDLNGGFFSYFHNHGLFISPKRKKTVLEMSLKQSQCPRS